MSGWTGQYHGIACRALWGMVAKHRIPSRIQAQGGARGVRRDALEIASSEPLNSRHTRQYKANIEGIQGKASRSVRRDALEIASSEPLNSRHTRQYKANIQGIECKAIDVWMDRPVPWKSPAEHRGAWLRNTASPAGLKPKAAPEACAEMLSK